MTMCDHEEHPFVCHACVRVYCEKCSSRYACEICGYHCCKYCERCCWQCVMPNCQTIVRRWQHQDVTQNFQFCSNCSTSVASLMQNINVPNVPNVSNDSSIPIDTENEPRCEDCAHGQEYPKESKKDF